MQLEKKIKSVTIMIKMVGTACNMKCDYCYEHITEDSHKNIYGVTGEDVIDYLRQFVEYKHVFILFHGGEPFLAKYNEVRKCLEYIKQNFKYDYKIQFQTNGTLLNDEWIYLLRQYEPNISLSISLDPRGDKDLRKSQGFEYRKIVMENLKKYSNSINNIGIVAVAHKYNSKYFEMYIEELIKMGIKSLTINKYRGISEDSEPFITEQEYVELLKSVTLKWIQKGWYKKINIQPLNALFSPRKNRLCIYLSDTNKCSYFKTFYGKNEISDYCDHVIPNNFPKLDSKCLNCDIYEFCGGGCLVEFKDSTFCDARRDLCEFVRRMKNESQ